jgi:hypothetical protein
MRCVILGAHFDDVEIGMGCTVMRHIADGDDVFFIITSSDDNLSGDANNRLSEQCNVLDFWGCDRNQLFCFGGECLISEIVNQVDLLKPDIIYTHYYQDTHQDHVRCSRIGLAASRQINTSLFFYGGRSSFGFVPNFFNMIDFPTKEKMLLFFRSQIERKTVEIDAIKIIHSYYGMIFFGGGYAEGFIVFKHGVRKNVG